MKRLAVGVDWMKWTVEKQHPQFWYSLEGLKECFHRKKHERITWELKRSRVAVLWEVKCDSYKLVLELHLNGRGSYFSNFCQYAPLAVFKLFDTKSGLSVWATQQTWIDYPFIVISLNAEISLVVSPFSLEASLLVKMFPKVIAMSIWTSFSVCGYQRVNIIQKNRNSRLTHLSQKTEIQDWDILAKNLPKQRHL